MRVFISHSSNDTGIVQHVVMLLRLALSLPAEEIRCSSLDGHRLGAGDDIDEVLRKEVTGADAFVVILTQASIESPYVMLEVGARWGAGQQVIPLLACAGTELQVRGPMAGLNVLDLRKEGQVHQFLKDLAFKLDVSLSSPAAYGDSLRILLSTAALTEELGAVAVDVSREASVRAEAAALQSHAALSTSELEVLRLLLNGEEYFLHADGVAFGLDWGLARAVAVLDVLEEDGFVNWEEGNGWSLTPMAVRHLLRADDEFEW